MALSSMLYPFCHIHYNTWINIIILVLSNPLYSVVLSYLCISQLLRFLKINFSWVCFNCFFRKYNSPAVRTFYLLLIFNFQDNSATFFLLFGLNLIIICWKFVWFCSRTDLLTNVILAFLQAAQYLDCFSAFKSIIREHLLCHKIPKLSRKANVVSEFLTESGEAHPWQILYLWKTLTMSFNSFEEDTYSDKNPISCVFIGPSITDACTVISLYP